MTRQEAMDIIKNEHLGHYNIFPDDSASSYEVVIKKISGKYVVYDTDERAVVYPKSVNEFDTENEAFDRFIDDLRFVNQLLKNN